MSPWRRPDASNSVTTDAAAGTEVAVSSSMRGAATLATATLATAAANSGGPTHPPPRRRRRRPSLRGVVQIDLPGAQRRSRLSLTDDDDDSTTSRHHCCSHLRETWLLSPRIFCLSRTSTCCSAGQRFSRRANVQTLVGRKCFLCPNDVIQVIHCFPRVHKFITCRVRCTPKIRTRVLRAVPTVPPR